MCVDTCARSRASVNVCVPKNIPALISMHVYIHTHTNSHNTNAKNKQTNRETTRREEREARKGRDGSNQKMNKNVARKSLQIFTLS